VISLILRFPISRSPSVFMNLTAWEHCDLDNVYCSNPVSLQISCNILFPIVGLKMSSIPNFALESPKRVTIWCFGSWSNTSSSS